MTNIFTKLINDETGFIVETTDNLTTYIGKETIGVHTFEALVVDRGARVSFGGDRIGVGFRQRTAQPKHEIGLLRGRFDA